MFEEEEEEEEEDGIRGFDLGFLLLTEIKISYS